jgi:hypothetical protein
MMKLVSAAALASGLLLCGVAHAGDVAITPAGTVATFPLKSGGMLRSADGHRIGAIDAVDTGKDGTPITAQVIVDQHIVRIPAATITSTDKSHFTTSLTYKAVESL